MITTETAVAPQYVTTPPSLPPPPIGKFEPASDASASHELSLELASREPASFLEVEASPCITLSSPSPAPSFAPASPPQPASATSTTTPIGRRLLLIRRPSASEWANRTPDEYRETDGAHDAKMLAFLVDRLLLGLPATFPIREGFPQEKASLLVHHVVGYGRSNDEKSG